MGAGNWIRRASKTSAANVIDQTGLRKALGALRRSQTGGRRVHILGYHRVVEDFGFEAQRSIPGTLISADVFRKQLEVAALSGFDFATLGEALDVLSGARASKRDLLVISFDDGYRDVYELAFPILKRMGIPAIIYVSTGLIGTQRRFDHDRLYHLLHLAARRRLRLPVRLGNEAHTPALASLAEAIRHGEGTLSTALDGFIATQPAQVIRQVIQLFEQQLRGEQLVPPTGEVLRWDELAAMQRAGIDVGAHTVNHTVLTHEPPDAAEAEVRACKAELENRLGVLVRDFAYCNGWYSRSLIEILARNGFRSAVTTEDLPNRIGSDPFTLKRKVMWENFSMGLFGAFSPALTACHLDDTFGVLGLTRPIKGNRMQTGPSLLEL